MFACCRKPEPEVELEIRTQPKPTKTTFREGSDSPKILVQQSNLTKQIVNSLESDKPDVQQEQSVNGGFVPLQTHKPIENKNRTEDVHDTLEPTPLKQNAPSTREQKDNADKLEVPQRKEEAQGELESPRLDEEF